MRRPGGNVTPPSRRQSQAGCPVSTGSREKPALRVLACLLLALYSQLPSQGVPQTVPDAQAHADRGLQLAQEGNLAHAESELRRAVELAPQDPSYLTHLGTILAMERKLEESTECFAKALKADPGDLTARRYLAANLWQLHRPEEAKRHLEFVR